MALSLKTGSGWDINVLYPGAGMHEKSLVIKSDEEPPVNIRVDLSPSELRELIFMLEEN